MSRDFYVPRAFLLGDVTPARPKPSLARYLEDIIWPFDLQHFSKDTRASILADRSGEVSYIQYLAAQENRIIMAEPAPIVYDQLILFLWDPDAVLVRFYVST